MPRRRSPASVDPSRLHGSQAADPLAHTGHRGWLQRLGAVGFAFFLIKGLLWLILPALLAYFGWR